MSEIFSPLDNWSHFRKLIKQSPQPFVPYIGLFLSDLTFIKDGGGTSLLNGHLGWHKMQKIGGILQKIQILQIHNNFADIAPDLTILKFIASEFFTLEENELLRRSKVLEPAMRKT